jgi:hypothetical protein
VTDGCFPTSRQDVLPFSLDVREAARGAPLGQRYGRIHRAVAQRVYSHGPRSRHSAERRGQTETASRACSIPKALLAAALATPGTQCPKQHRLLRRRQIESGSLVMRNTERSQTRPRLPPKRWHISPSSPSRIASSLWHSVSARLAASRWERWEFQSKSRCRIESSFCAATDANSAAKVVCETRFFGIGSDLRCCRAVCRYALDLTNVC